MEAFLSRTCVRSPRRSAGLLGGPGQSGRTLPSTLTSSPLIPDRSPPSLTPPCLGYPTPLKTHGSTEPRLPGQEPPEPLVYLHSSSNAPGLAPAPGAAAALPSQACPAPPPLSRGSAPSVRTPSFGSSRRVSLILLFLQRFHRALRGFDPHPSPPNHVLYVTI